MRVHAETVISERDQKLFHSIKIAIDKLYYPVTNCHNIAKAVAAVFKLKCVDGHFQRRYEHSWCVSDIGNVFDVYPVGLIGGPILLDGNIASWLDMYRETTNWDDRRDMFEIGKLTEILSGVVIQ
jgi:hypothetical protein